MKKFRYLFIMLLLMFPMIFSGCSKIETKTLAHELDYTIKNFIDSTNNLDWPTDENLVNLEKDEASNASTSADTDIDTTEIYAWLEHLHSKINILLSKRGDLLIFVNEMQSGNTMLSNENLIAIKVYMDIIKDNSNYLYRHNGILRNQIDEASKLTIDKTNINLINAYIVKAVETLETRSAKIDTSILAMNSIIDIISKHLVNDYFNYNTFEIPEEETLPPKQIDENQEISPEQTPDNNNGLEQITENQNSKENINMENNNEIDIKVDENTNKDSSDDTTQEASALDQNSSTEESKSEPDDSPIIRETIKEQAI